MSMALLYNKLLKIVIRSLLAFVPTDYQLDIDYKFVIKN